MVRTGKVLNKLGRSNIKSPCFGFQNCVAIFWLKKLPKLSFTEPKQINNN